MDIHRVRLFWLGLCVLTASAWGFASRADGQTFYEFAPLPTTTVDPDLGYEAKLDLRNRVGDADEDGGVAAQVGGCEPIGAFNSPFTGSLRYRGNLVRITEPNVVLREIKMQLNFTGTADLYVSVHRRDLDGTYSRFPTNSQDFVIQGAVGTGSATFYPTGSINGGAGLALPPGFDYAIAVAWGPESITFAHDGLSYPRSFSNGSVLGSLAFNLGNFDPPQPPVSDNLPALQVFGGGAYGMQLCFVPLPGACCSGGACQDKLESQCTGVGSFFHGQRTTCAETPCEFGACCNNKCGGCVADYTPEACTASGGIAHWPGAVCPNPSTSLCPKVTGACCTGTSCIDTKCEAECLADGGVYRGDGTDCTPNICQGACCVSGGCLNRTPNGCTGLNGIYKDDGTTCATLPSDQQCGGACCYGFTGLDFCEVTSSRSLCTYDPSGFPLSAYRGDGTICETSCGLIGQFSGCCLPDGSCMNTTQSVCIASWVQGVFLSGVRCESAPQTCPNLVNRCCLGDGSCQLLTGSACTSRGGAIVAGQTTCSPTACASSGGACCGTATGACTMSTQAQCELQGGFYRGDNSNCSSPSATCPGFGACCRGDGSCFDDFTAAGCGLIAGAFEGPSTACFEPPVDCDIRGACCATTGECLFVDTATCDEVGGDFSAVGVACATDTCVSGACCNNHVCATRTQASCAIEGGVYQGNNSVCDAETCAPVGGCCLNGSCTVGTELACGTSLGTYLGDDTVCLAESCLIGVCCQPNESCTENALAGACAGPGQSFTAGALCADVQCVAAPTGACCNGTTCTASTVAECGVSGGTYKGDNVACEPTTCAPACMAIVSTSPLNCAIDARQPNPPGNSGAPQGWNAITFTFDCSDTSGLTAGNFNVTTTPSGTAPTVTGVTPNGSSIAVNLSGPIPPGAWTCVEYVPTHAKRCLGFLPADINSDRTAAPVDILDLIDHLNGVRVPALLLHQCDIDRSNLCAPPDILGEIDLLNGASGFAVWNGRNIPLCPSALP